MRYAARRDASEPAIVNLLKGLGFGVCRMDRPVDLLVSFRGKNYLIECKSGSKGYAKKLNDNQQAFADKWNAPVFVLRDEDEAMAWAQAVAANADLTTWQHISDPVNNIIERLRAKL